MRKVLLSSLVVLACVAVAGAQSLQKKAARINVEVCSAMKHKDMAKFEKVTRGAVTDDFQYKENGQTQTYDQMLAMMKQSFMMMKKVTTCTAVSDHFKIHGDSATSTTHHMMVAMMGGPDKKSHRMVMTGSSLDTYRKEGKVWKLASMDWSNSKMTLDGKPFNPAAMGAPQGGAGH